MQQSEFERMLNDVRRLTTEQRQQLQDALKDTLSSPDIPISVLKRQADMNAKRVCVHCGEGGVVKNGESAGLTRFRCRATDCRKTYNALAGSTFQKLRHKEKWQLFQTCLRDRLTLHESAERCGISYPTAFKWRHRFLAAEREESKVGGLAGKVKTYDL